MTLLPHRLGRRTEGVLSRSRRPKGAVLLQGFPTSSHMFRDLIPTLADCNHVVAPDLPGFGFANAPDRTRFGYTFDHLAEVAERFTE